VVDEQCVNCVGGEQHVIILSEAATEFLALLHYFERSLKDLEVDCYRGCLEAVIIIPRHQWIVNLFQIFIKPLC
jgi:hypothetical protein